LSSLEANYPEKNRKEISFSTNQKKFNKEIFPAFAEESLFFRQTILNANKKQQGK
jgi:hypothetical protein